MKILYVIGLLFLVFAPFESAADARKIFDQYSEGKSGVYKNARSTTFYGGSFTGRINRNPIDLVGFQSPSVSAGCGGIDMFSGSFSIVSGDELVQMLRGVAQGVPSYFFQLALSSICSQCEQLMSELNEKIAELNQWGRLSCEEAGDWIMQTGDPQGKARAAMRSVLPAKDAIDGYADGAMDWLAQRDFGTSGFIQGLNATKESALSLVDGNVLAQLLNETTNFTYKYVDGGDQITRKQKFVELISSLNGRVYISELDDACVDSANAATGNESSSCIKSEIKMSVLPMSIFFQGEEDASEMEYYKCTGGGSTLLERCTQMTAEKYNSTSSEFKQRAGILSQIRKLIDNKDASTPTGLGIIQRLRFKQNFSADQVKLLEMARYNFVDVARSNSGVRGIKIEYVIADVEVRIVEDFYNETKLILDKLATVASRSSSKIDDTMIDEITSNLKSNYLNYRVEVVKNRDAAIKRLEVAIAASKSVDDVKPK